ncbi:MAG TPA: DUF4349 domain-containing protein [Thermoleophilaceae bacterium]|jgi:hypothetical protein
MSTVDPIAALRGVDEALASGRATAADPAERELQELALALEADSPAPDPDFECRLDARVADRFGRRKPRRGRIPRPRLGLVGAAASLLLAVGVAGALSGVLGDRDSGPTPLAETAPAPTAKSLDAQSAEGTALRGAPAAARRVERSSELTLAAPDDRLEKVGGQILRVVDRHRGYVLNSSVSSGQGSTHSGLFELRVPTDRLQAAIADLSRLADVRARTDTGHDVTGEFTSVSDRLTADVVERRGLLRRLGHAASAQEADRLRSRLDRLSVEIHRLREQVRDLRQRTDFTRVSVSLVAKTAAHGAAGPLGGVDRALRGSLRALVGATAIVLRVTAAVLPFAVLGAMGWVAAGGVRRRRREAVLS